MIIAGRIWLDIRPNGGEAGALTVKVIGRHGSSYRNPSAGGAKKLKLSAAPFECYYLFKVLSFLISYFLELSRPVILLFASMMRDRQRSRV